MAVTRRTLAMQAELAEQLRNTTDAHTRDLVRAWARAWDEVAPDLSAVLVDMLLDDEKITRARLMRSTRLRRALAVIGTQLETLARESGVRISGDVHAVVDHAGGAQASIIDSQLPAGSDLIDDLGSWSRVDDQQIAAIVERTTQQITALHYPISAEAYDAVQRELVRGIAAGSNPRATAARMVRRVEGRFNGGLTRALVISRTETLDAHRQAAMLGQAQHADVLAGWRWLATLDTRTCPSCVGQHGSLHDLDEDGPLDHQQGRCARVPVTKSWKDLGLSVAEPPSQVPDAAAWFEGLSKAEKLDLLGPSRYEAWAAGRYPMSAWSQRRQTDGWRDSFVPSTPPSPRSGRRAA